MVESRLIALVLSWVGEASEEEGKIAELGELLGSREELLAYLLGHPEFLRRHPAIAEQIRVLAANHGFQASTMRSGAGPPVGARDLTSKLEAAIVAQIAECAEGTPLVTQRDIIQRALIGAARTSGASPEKRISTAAEMPEEK